MSTTTSLSTPEITSSPTSTTSKIYYMKPILNNAPAEDSGYTPEINTSSQMGTSSSQMGTSSSQMGTTSSQMGTSSSQMGTTSSQMGTTSSQMSTSSSQMSTSSSQMSTSSSQMGTSSSQMGTSSSQMGTTSSQFKVLPVINNIPMDSNISTSTTSILTERPRTQVTFEEPVITTTPIEILLKSLQSSTSIQQETTSSNNNVSTSTPSSTTTKQQTTKIDTFINYIGDNIQSNLATGIPTNTNNIISISDTYNHILALNNDNTITEWGQVSIPIPANIKNPGSNFKIIKISAGADFSIAILKNMTNNEQSIYQWGTTKTSQDNNKPTNTNITDISAGGYHSLALTTDGYLIAWGYNGESRATVPTIYKTTKCTAISAGLMHSLALTEGNVIGWGNNAYAQAIIPPKLNGNIKAIDAGQYHSIALKNDGTVVQWGNISESVPTVLTDPNTAKVVAVKAGYGNSFAIREDGTAMAWGNNTSNKSIIPIILNNNIVAIETGEDHTFLLRRITTII
jgi:alpha-tubulin suppressor-like RCC1 family protein